ncbi:hypothetical protein AB7714_05680 [Tardiphaga sp. 1201_B9_N1_1]|uniref:hypothetical protein n=1 Tax=unclassified Tardiphaga TaxID=2631404 RepID=UPI003F2163DA
MALVTNPARIARAIELRNHAVDLVASRGAMANANDGGRSVQVMAFDEGRLSVLYKTPRTTLSSADAPAPFRPKGFMIEVWFDGRKTMSVHWDHEGPVEVVTFKPGDWENSIAEALAHPE